MSQTLVQPFRAQSNHTTFGATIETSHGPGRFVFDPPVRLERGRLYGLMLKSPLDKVELVRPGPMKLSRRSRRRWRARVRAGHMLIWHKIAEARRGR